MIDAKSKNNLKFCKKWKNFKEFYKNWNIENQNINKKLFKKFFGNDESYLINFSDNK